MKVFNMFLVKNPDKPQWLKRVKLLSKMEINTFVMEENWLNKILPIVFKSL